MDYLLSESHFFCKDSTFQKSISFLHIGFESKIEPNQQQGLKIVITIQEAEKILQEMTRAEKAQLLQWIVQDLGDSFPGIESNPDVCGGEPCIVRTRIPVWVLVQSKRLGMSEADLLRSYPNLRAEDLTTAWAYFRTHRNEILLQIRENEET